MQKKTYAVIVGSGSYIPTVKIPNTYFLNHRFYDSSGKLFDRTNEEIIEKFAQITGIKERRYVEPNQVASDIGALAAKEAIEDSAIDPETIDQIIVAHNFGDVSEDKKFTDQVPALSARIKYLLNIENPDCVAYDIPFGCAGWLQGVIQAKTFIESGIAKRILVVGTETISRIVDPHDRDSMIFADGAGAVLLEAKQSETPVGILHAKARTFAVPHAHILRMGNSYNTEEDYPLLIKMEGRRLYEQVITHVPAIIKECLDEAQVSIDDISNFLLHQANEKMDEAILKRLYKLYGEKTAPLEKMPMTISFLGNSSVATLPTLYNLIKKEQLEGHKIQPGEKIIFSSVGAGINLNALVYQEP